MSKSQVRRPVRQRYDELFASLPAERQSAHLRVIIKFLFAMAAKKQEAARLEGGAA